MNQYPSFDLVLTETKDLLIRQLSNVETIDTKASILAGFDGLILTASLAVLKDIPLLAASLKVGFGALFFLPLIVAGLVMAVASLALALWSYRVMNTRKS